MKEQTIYAVGFANQFYTYWEVSTTKNYTSEMGWHWTTYYRYIQNLSTDKELAMRKAQQMAPEGKFVEFWEELSGRSESWSSQSFEPGRFQFGRYIGERIVDVDDISYIVWYLNDRSLNDRRLKGMDLDELRDHLKSLDMLLIIKDDVVSIITEDEQRWIEERGNFEAFVNSLETGHFFEHGEKVEIEIMEIEAFSFEGAYGKCFVREYATREGQKVKYVGSAPQDISSTEYVKVWATVKHSEYDGKPETHIKRIKKS